jgi:hypothetical protein
MANSESPASSSKANSFIFMSHVLLNPESLAASRLPQRADEHTVHNRENGGVCADAERECQNGRYGEPRGFGEPAQAVTQILQEHFAGTLRRSRRAAAMSV